MCCMVLEDVHLDLGPGPLGSTINKILKIVKIMLTAKKPQVLDLLRQKLPGWTWKKST